MEGYNKKVVNTVKFSFNDIPKFEDNKKFNNNNNKLKKSLNDIKPKKIKPLKSSHNTEKNKNSKTLLDNTKKSEYLNDNQENLYKKANSRSISFPFKKVKSSISLKPIVDLNKKIDAIKDFSIYDNKISNKKNNYGLSELNEGNRSKLYSRKSIETLNNESFNKKLNSNSYLKEISANLSDINLNLLEKNENTINNENRLSTITTRVKQLEQQLSITMKELHEKNNIIYELKKELKEKDQLLKSSNDEKIILLQNKIQKSQEKLEIAYDYLKRYNITIDEDNKSDNESDQTFAITGDDVYSDNTEKHVHKFPYDFNQFSKQIKFLNHLSEEGIGQIVQHKNGAYTIKMPEPQILNVYSNGFIFNDEFHSFNESDSVFFIKEIVDGYFPFQLKEKYPEGVPFKLIDNHTSYYNSRPSYVPFTGKGVLARPSSSSTLSERSYNNSLDEKLEDNLLNDKLNVNYSYKEKINNKLHSPQINKISTNNNNINNSSNNNNNNNNNNNSITNTNNNKISKVELLESTKKNFLNALPKNTIKDGYVIDIRKATNDILFNNEHINKPILKEKEKDIIEMGIDENEEEIILDDKRGNMNFENEKITTIKIKNNINEYIVQMKYSDTVKALKENLEKKLSIKQNQFKLKMPFQFNDFEDYKTLEESSLVPNACLYIEII